VRVEPGLGGDGPSMPAVFIRAPLVEAVGDGVEVLAHAATPGDGEIRPVVLRQGSVLASAFHPELTPDRRLHRLFLAMVEGAGAVRDAPGVAAGVG
jgi:5'-phosphate synthase pdxT subunit